MERTLAVLDAMQKAGVIEKYAIGGAMAAVFYMEPIPTYHLDVFVLLPGPARPIVSLGPVYDYLGSKGYQPSKEHVIIEGVPVQLIPAYNALVAEAVDQARTIPFGGLATRVVGPEHLIAIMLQTGRKKDLARIAQFLDEVRLDPSKLREVLARHGLEDAWKRNFGGADA